MLLTARAADASPAARRRVAHAWGAGLAARFPGTRFEAAPAFDAASMRATAVGGVLVHEVEAGAHYQACTASMGSLRSSGSDTGARPAASIGR